MALRFPLAMTLGIAATSPRRSWPAPSAPHGAHARAAPRLQPHLHRFAVEFGNMSRPSSKSCRSMNAWPPLTSVAPRSSRFAAASR